VLAFIPATGIDWARRAFDLHYPMWLLWIDYALTTLVLVLLVAYMVLRGQEVLSHRRAQTGH
jgi:hypothetical protein